MLNNQIVKHKNLHNSIADLDQIDYDKLVSSQRHKLKREDVCYSNQKNETSRDDKMFHISENQTFNLVTVAVEGADEKITYKKVHQNDIGLSPLKFMDILPPRVKIAKLYDKDYNLQSLDLYDNPIFVDESRPRMNKNASINL